MPKDLTHFQTFIRKCIKDNLILEQPFSQFLSQNHSPNNNPVFFQPKFIESYFIKTLTEFFTIAAECDQFYLTNTDGEVQHLREQLNDCVPLISKILNIREIQTEGKYLVQIFDKAACANLKEQMLTLEPTAYPQ